MTRERRRYGAGRGSVAPPLNLCAQVEQPHVAAQALER
jgi:hypothetical protein